MSHKFKVRRNENYSFFQTKEVMSEAVFLWYLSVLMFAVK